MSEMLQSLVYNYTHIVMKGERGWIYMYIKRVAHCLIREFLIHWEAVSRSTKWRPFANLFLDDFYASLILNPENSMFKFCIHSLFQAGKQLLLAQSKYKQTTSSKSHPIMIAFSHSPLAAGNWDTPCTSPIHGSHSTLCLEKLRSKYELFNEFMQPLAWVSSLKIYYSKFGLLSFKLCKKSKSGYLSQSIKILPLNHVALMHLKYC